MTEITIQAQKAQALYDAFRTEIEETSGWYTQPETSTTGRTILEAEPAMKITFIQIAIQVQDTYHYAVTSLLCQLLKRPLPYTHEDVHTLLQSMVEQERLRENLRTLINYAQTNDRSQGPVLLAEVHSALEQLRTQLQARSTSAKHNDLLEEVESMLRGNHPWYHTYANLRNIMGEIRRLEQWCQLIPVKPLMHSLSRPLRNMKLLAECRPELEQLRQLVTSRYTSVDQRKLLKLLDNILDGQQAPLNPMQADDWSKSLFVSLEKLDEQLRSPWLALLHHCSTARGAAPSSKWSTPLPGLLADLGLDHFQALTIEWFRALTQNKGGRLDDENTILLKGLAWCCAGQSNPSLSAVLADAAIEGYRKLPGLGPRAAMVAGACLYALKNMPDLHSIAQIERVRLNVKQASYLKGIEQILDEMAQQTGMSREDLEELTIPTFDLEAGHLRLTFGSEVAELKIEGSEVHVQWYDAAGKQRKSSSAKVKRLYKTELKDLKRRGDDIKHMLIAQRDRLERLALGERQWKLLDWRERYLEHPLVGSLAKRLLWRFTYEDQVVDAIYCEGQFVNAANQQQQLPDDAQVSLWHPIFCSASEIQAWRIWLEEHRITQPFKQAHREIYLLTDAERTTRTYSNRFAAHILKQHQFHALAIARGWHNQLRLMVDDTYEPATILLPQWNLRAEYWIEGAGEEYGVDSNDAGTYLRVATDQVRFYPLHAIRNYAHAGGGGYRPNLRPGQTVHGIEPLPLTEIPPLVFSEVMRDVDLFVGVSSIGNDPTWQDGGPEGRYQDYWHTYSFGDLSATAKTRKQLLERLIPRLAIANRCTINDRFLIVRGDLRTYKIHLGSSNILMEPNDQYLCIVPGRGVQASDDTIFLPFEGDIVFSTILSKAFLLAEDTQITDPTITRQIHT